MKNYFSRAQTTGSSNTRQVLLIIPLHAVSYFSEQFLIP